MLSVCLVPLQPPNTRHIWAFNVIFSAVLVKQRSIIRETQKSTSSRLQENAESLSVETVSRLELVVHVVPDNAAYHCVFLRNLKYFLTSYELAAVPGGAWVP